MWSLLMARWIDSKAYTPSTFFPPRWTLKDRQNRPRHTVAQSRAGRAGRAGSEMRGVQLVPSSSPTLPPIHDGLDVNVTSTVTWFHLNHDIVSRLIYKLSFYGGHPITYPMEIPHSFHGTCHKTPHGISYNISWDFPWGIPLVPIRRPVGSDIGSCADVPSGAFTLCLMNPHGSTRHPWDLLRLHRGLHRIFVDPLGGLGTPEEIVHPKGTPVGIARKQDVPWKVSDRKQNIRWKVMGSTMHLTLQQ